MAPLAPATRTVRDFLDADTLRPLLRPSTARGLLSLATTWGMIAGSFVLLGTYPSVWTWTVAVVVLGGRQLALAVLMHEAAHRCLVADRTWNDRLGHWLAAAPTWNQLALYRKHHVAHHRRAGHASDPDYGLIADLPMSRRSLFRKTLRDLSGITAAKRVYGLLMMDLGYLSYTVSTGAKPIAQERTLRERFRRLLRYTGPMLLTQSVLAGGLALAGIGWTYAAWWIAWGTSYSLFLRIRALAEHGGAALDRDPLHNTRTTRASPLARITVAPHHVNYHLEHHLLPMLPHYRLPLLHRMLQKDPRYRSEALLAPDYPAVLRSIVA